MSRLRCTTSAMVLFDGKYWTSYLTAIDIWAESIQLQDIRKKNKLLNLWPWKWRSRSTRKKTEWTNEGTKKRTNERTNEWTNEWMDEWTNERTTNEGTNDQSRLTGNVSSIVNQAGWLPFANKEYQHTTLIFRNFRYPSKHVYTNLDTITLTNERREGRTN